MAKIQEMCAALKVLSEAKARDELMMPVEVGERIGMTAEYAGPLLGNMHERQPVEKPDKRKNRYRISQKGEEFLANPPEEPQVKQEKPPTVLRTVPPTVPPIVPPTPPKEDSVIPSQADIFRSIAEQLGITKAMDTAKGGTPLNAIINYVQRTGLLNKVPFRAVDQHKRQHPCLVTSVDVTDGEAKTTGLLEYSPGDGAFKRPSLHYCN
jgi:hypothetical protein